MKKLHPLAFPIAMVFGLLAIAILARPVTSAGVRTVVEAEPIAEYRGRAVSLYEDPGTGCQYLVFQGNGISVIPRIRPDAGGFVCDGAMLEEFN